jgi:hypothetical protein
MEPTHSAPPLSPQEAGISERCPPAPDTNALLGESGELPRNAETLCPLGAMDSALDL